MAAGIDRDAAVEIQRRAFRDFVTMLGGAAPESRVLELDDDVRAAIVPAVPGRSIANSVTYRDPASLAASLEVLAATYDLLGVRAWTVWAPEDDRDAIDALERAGHVLDGRPAAMVLDLGELPAAEVGDLDWDAGGGWELLGRLNDEAYGAVAGGGLAPALRHPPSDLAVRIHQARVEGEPACVLATIDHAPAHGAAGPDCGVYFVATPERFRRRGLATRLLAAALADARDRGCATSSLQASALGEPVYRALGYETAFRFTMYERRRPREAD
ncbi:MAG TPA: GNAT family N-acetyltransferase [Solirubrobacterales bacterium]|nr:GNAT family N-acetyltransferase [Solirubrobacterales bacterium]